MVKRFLLPLLAAIIVLAMIIPGCGEPVEPIEPEPDPDEIELFVWIRTEDEREEMGDYLVNQLNKVGFKATARKGDRDTCNPVVYGEPSTGLWHAYTEGWVGGAVPRDEGWNFAFFSTVLGVPWMGPLWTYYADEDSHPEFYEAAEILWDNLFSDLDERNDAFEICMWADMQLAYRVWLIDSQGYDMHRADVNVAADGAGGIGASALWGHTVHEHAGDGVPVPGGTVSMAIRGMFGDPWNPISGSNWLFDNTPIRATSDRGTYPDTRDGLYWPGRIEKADVYVLGTLPIGQSLGVTPPHTWLTLTPRALGHDDLTAPDDAWADWDYDPVLEEWRFFTVEEKMDEGSPVYDADYTPTGLAMTRSYYPAGTFGIELHDGSGLSMADFLTGAILTFDRAKKDSDIYDEGSVALFNSFMGSFKGVRFITDEPGYDLVVENWTAYWNMDAELMVSTWWPQYRQGPGFWHNLAPAIRGEANSLMAFSEDKANTLEVVWTNYIAGEGLAALKTQLAAAKTEGFMPYEDSIRAFYVGNFVDGGATLDAEIVERYDNLDAWVTAQDHFWVGSGPLYLDSFDTTGKTMVLKRHAGYPDDADKWLFLMGLPATGLARSGAWVDQVNLEVITAADEAFGRLQLGTLDLFASTLVDAEIFEDVQADPNVTFQSTVGAPNSFSFNPAGPILDGKLNPFYYAEIREAMHFLVDRDEIVGTILGGLAVPKFTPLTVGAPDISDPDRSKAVYEAIAAFYAFDEDEADSRIEAAMLAIEGVTRDEDGKYYYLEP